MVQNEMIVLPCKKCKIKYDNGKYKSSGLNCFLKSNKKEKN